jgi:alpha-amylase
VGIFTVLLAFLSCGITLEYPSFPQPTKPSAGTWEYPNNSGPSSPANTRTGNEGTWYEIFTGSFYSSKNNGKGDIKGITGNLDYLNDSHTHTAGVECNKSLHIDGIWLTPIMPAPSYHKYDTTDYLNVDPAFGTLADVKELLSECHKRGVKLIVDLAVNHTSPQHSWFLEALEEFKSGNLNRYYNYYNFHTSYNRDPNRWDEFHDISGHWYRPDEMGLPEVKTPGSEYVFYYGAFGREMPDLNWDNSLVKQEFDKIIKFWLVDMGIDGFRLDATKHIYEVGEYTGNTGKNITFWTWFATTCRKYKSNTYMVGECLDGDDIILEYHRPGMSSFALSFANDYGRIIRAALMDVNNGNDRNERKGWNFAEGVLWYSWEVKNRHPLATFSPFLSNHDFDRSSRYLVNDEERKMAAAMLLLVPGTPFMYYGEEIGIRGWKIDGNDKFVRGPMIFEYNDMTGYGRPEPPDGGWTAEWQGDNAQGMPIMWTTPAPENKPQGGGVKEQLAMPESLLRYYITVGNYKKKYPWIAWGSTSFEGLNVDSKNQVAAFRITDNDPASQTYGKSVVIAHNTSKNESSDPGYANGYISVPKAKGYDAISAWGAARKVWDDEYTPGVYWITPYSTVIFREYDE